MQKKPLKLVTHNAGFHTDDVFACAILMLGLPNVEVIRSRDQVVIDAADGAFDVGGVYDAEKLRFDHHQPGGAGMRPNNIPYAAAGLVWKTFGKELSGSPDVADRVDRKLMQPIDAMDNGIDLVKNIFPGVYPYTFQTLTHIFNPTWNEDGKMVNTQFFEVVAIAQKVLLREIRQAIDHHEAAGFVQDAYERAPDKRIIELERNYPWEESIAKTPEPLYVVLPRTEGKNWKVEAVRSNPYSYESRKKLPASWAGKKDAEFAKLTGVSDAVFCHNGCFMAVAKSREGALKLAQLAVAA